MSSTIVTARSAEGPAGFLGLSATHLCAEPPLMLASIDKRTSALSTVLAAGHFAVNFLGHDASAIADMFGGNADAKTHQPKYMWDAAKVGYKSITEGDLRKADHFLIRDANAVAFDPNAGWKGKGVWTTWGTRTPFHSETGKGTMDKVVHFQVRPNPLAD